MRKVLDRESSDMTLDAQERGVFSLDITATDQALSNNDRKSSTVRVRLCCYFSVGLLCLFVCLFNSSVSKGKSRVPFKPQLEFPGRFCKLKKKAGYNFSI